MKAIFVHDHKFRRINGNIYSPGGLPNDVLSRYVEWFGKLTVIGRIIDEKKVKDNYSKITNINVSVQSGDNLKAIIKVADCVIARLPSINGYKAITYAKKYKKPYLVEVVGCTFDSYWNYGFKGKILAVPAYIVMRHYIKNAPYALYVTEEFLQKRYPCKGKTVGVSDVAIEKTENTVIQNRIEKYKYINNNIVLGTAAAIDVIYKGQEYVIRALPELMSLTGKNIIYEMVGSGDPKRLLRIAEKCGVDNHVRIKGTIPHDEVFAWLDQIDYYVQPSMQEGLSRALVEAMSRGLPCVASDCGGNTELLSSDYIVKIKPRKNYSKRIANILKQVIESDARPICKTNFEKSNTNYGTLHLNMIREDFYKSFVAYVNNKTSHK